jgi:hexokinase
MSKLGKNIEREFKRDVNQVFDSVNFDVQHINNVSAELVELENKQLQNISYVRVSLKLHKHFKKKSKSLLTNKFCSISTI